MTGSFTDGTRRSANQHPKAMKKIASAGGTAGGGIANQLLSNPATSTPKLRNSPATVPKMPVSTDSPRSTPHPAVISRSSPVVNTATGTSTPVAATGNTPTNVMPRTSAPIKKTDKPSARGSPPAPIRTSGELGTTAVSGTLATA